MARCANCGTENSETARFCNDCAKPLGDEATEPAPPPEPAAPTPPPPEIAAPTAPPGTGGSVGPPGFGVQVRQFLRRATSERTGMVAAGVVAAVCAVVSLVGWLPLSIPARALGAVVPGGSCTGQTPGTPFMYVCSAWVGFLTVLVPLAIIALVVVARVPIARGLAALLARLPEEARFLAAPVVATVLFELAWAGVHYETSGQTGLLPQVLFPAVIGLFTFVLMRWNTQLQRALSRILALRDRYPMRLRVGAAVAIPLVVSLLITLEPRVTQTALKEQIVVLVALACGYIAFVPRGGDLAAGVGTIVSELRRG